MRREGEKYKIPRRLRDSARIRVRICNGKARSRLRFKRGAYYRSISTWVMDDARFCQLGTSDSTGV